MKNLSISIQIRILVCILIFFLVGGLLHAQEKVQYTLTINRIGEGGTVVPGVGTFSYSAGLTAFISVVPTPDWAFDHWEGAASGSGWYNQVYMDGNKTVTAVFVPAVWRLTIEHAGNAVGNTFPQAGVYGCIDGQSIGISSGTSPGVYFGGWSGDAHGASEFITITMNSNKYIIATFADTGYELNVYVEGEGGATPGPMGNPHRYAEGVIISITTYKTNDLWRFDHWSGDLPETASPRYYILMNVPMDQNRNITAHFIEKPWYMLTVEVQGEGSVSITPGFNDPTTVSTGVHEFDFIEWTYIRGEALATTPGWRFLRWEGDFGDMSATYPRCAFSMDQDRYVWCIFTNLTNVPDVIGSTLSSAATAITNAFLSVGEVIEVCNDEIPEGYVINQNPIGGTTVVMDSTVALWVSTGPCPPEGEGIIEGTPDGVIEGTPDGVIEGTPDGVIEGTPDGVIEGTPDGVIEGIPDGVIEGTPDGEGIQEGTIEGEGTTEGTTEGEGTVEGEICVREETCPNFAWEVKKMADFFGLTLNNLDTNQSSIPDEWEIELVKFLLCSPQGIWENQFICKYVENYNILQTELLFHTTYYSYRHVLTGLLTIGGNLSNLINTLQIQNTYSSFEYPSGIFPLMPDADVDNDGMSIYEEYQFVLSYNGTKVEFVQLVFNINPVPDYHSADTNKDNKIDLRELLRVIQFFNSGGFHCEEGTEDGYAPGYGESFDFSCFPHTLDYNPQDWQFNLEEILRAVQFFNSQGYEVCPYLSEDHYCPIFN
ncbi:MAG TPA: PASTA domain-containing protein [Candidatus Hydrogenedens sp.]|nr:PASTA domain-containing protein [Candidatus Hydrogenedens sp.]